MEIVQMLCPSSKYSIKAPYSMVPDGITIHNTANDASAKNEVSYMISNNNQVSYHWAVDDVRAVQGIQHDRNAWHAGDGGSGYGNRHTIGIEICYSKSGGDKFHAAETNAAELIARLMLQYGWGVDKIDTKQINTHQSRSGKYCPHRTLDEGIDRLYNMIKQKYAELSGQSVPEETQPTEQSANGDSYLVKVNTSALNIREGAGTNFNIVGCIKDYGTYTIIETSNNWGKLKSGRGWICLDYTKRIDGETNTTETTTQPSDHYVGENVNINGVYTTSMSTNKLNPAVKSGTITKIVNGANNPYLLNNGNIGWVNDSCIVCGNSQNSQPATTSFSKGQRVLLKTSASTYCTGQKIPSSVKGKTYTIMQVGSGNTHPDGVLLQEIMSWVYKKDVQ